ncbi:MAG: DmsC/YnfH family molybdoenzyme membrane anchor subunit [Chloroflexota bacterium]
MNVREWSLILFTILGQMSVGAFLFLVVVYFYANRKAGAEEANRFGDRALYAILPVMVLAFLASFLHLGKIANAPKAVTNLATSWLSREILFGVLFAVVAFLFAFLQWRKIGSFAVRSIVAVITGLVGIALVYSMSAIYMMETQPAWNTFATPAQFATTTLLLGMLALGAAFVANYAYVAKKVPEHVETQSKLLLSVMRWVATGSVVLLGVEFIIIPIYLSLLASMGGEAAQTASLMISNFGVVFGFRLFLVFLGAGILCVFIFKNALGPGKEKALSYFAYSAFVLVLAAEILGRFLFYATHVQIGI